MTVLVRDPDFTLHVGDVRDVLATLEPGSMNCVITSPPYWGLRDYGTGAWAGGDPDCDHVPPKREHGVYTNGQGQAYKSSNTNWDAPHKSYGQTCGKCGATRQDQQLGLEPTPDQYVTNMVAVFRDVRRVLADHGTCWVNLGDSYASGGTGWRPGNPDKNGGNSNRDGVAVPPGLKPKDLVGIPWRVAFALQADGWYLRSDIIWSKPNPMPESVTDRPTKAHEYVFLLTKRPRYWFDAEAVREPQTTPAVGMDGRRPPPNKGELRGMTRAGNRAADGWIPNAYNNPAGRNVRSVWEIATQPYPEAHFATYPEELVRRCLLAGCPEWVCRTCGKARERIVEVAYSRAHGGTTGKTRNLAEPDGRTNGTGWTGKPVLNKHAETLGWSDCGHNDYRPGVVLDPFLGSGTTALVARRHGRRCVGIELSPEYAALAARRLQQLSLLAEPA